MKKSKKQPILGASQIIMIVFLAGLLVLSSALGMNTATLVITICVVLVALGLGILFGIFFTKRNYS